MLSRHRKLAEHSLTPFVKHLAKVHPNVLTLIGSIPPLLFFVAVITHNYILALLFFLGNIIDLLDGMVARKYHQVTRFGGFLDSLFDRISDFLIITAFGFAHLVRWEIIAPLLLAAYLTSYARSRGELADNTVSFAVGIIERPERLVIIFFSLLLFLIFPTLLWGGFNIIEIVFLILTILSGYTVIQRILHAYKNL